MDVSVVIPTRDRRHSLERTLRALTQQRIAPSRFEVVVAVDGARDGTAAYLSALAMPYGLVTVASGEPRGPAAARNQGAAAASGELLVFLDDDVEPGPDLLGAHLDAHRRGTQASVGYLPPAFDGRPRDFFQATLHGWWETMFERMRRPGHRYWFRDLLTGNCAIGAACFAELGGFDAAFRCHEDYELGVRLIAGKGVMRFVPDAAGLHHENTRLPGSLARKRDEGRADVAMVRKHPHVAPSLPLGAFTERATRMHRLLRRLAFEQPALGRALAAGMARMLPALERGRFRGRWRRRVYDLLVYFYWRGVADEIPSLAALRSLLDGCAARAGWSPMTLQVDIGDGLDLVMAQVDRHRPDAVRVMLNGLEIGSITPVPGSERLSGRHLRAALARELSGTVVSVLGRTGHLPVESREDGLVATAALPTDTWAL